MRSRSRKEQRRLPWGDVTSSGRERARLRASTRWGLLEIMGPVWSRASGRRRRESMALWKPDQTSYPSARMAMQAPREQLGYVVTFNPTASNGRLCAARADLDPKSKTDSQSSGAPRRRMPATSWITLAGTRAAPRSVRMHRILISSGATCGPGRAVAIYIFDTKPYPGVRSRRRRSRPRRYVAHGLQPADTVHCGPDAITSARWARPAATGRAEYSCLTTRASTRSDHGKSIAGRRFADDFWWHLGGTCRHQRMGHAQHDRKRRRARIAARQQVRTAIQSDLRTGGI